jgi:hypothetical protein
MTVLDTDAGPISRDSHGAFSFAGVKRDCLRLYESCFKNHTNIILKHDAFDHLVPIVRQPIIAGQNRDSGC